MKLNDKGSVTIFVVIIFMAIIMTFGMYLNDSVNDLTENNVMRVAQNTSRNVQASYVPKLYQSYGLLAYTKESAEDELWLSLETGLSDNLGIGLLPYHFADTFEYRIEKTEDMSTLKSVFEQMTRQAKFHVPEEFIENQEIVGDIFKKAKAARKKIEKIEGLTDGLSELKKLNDQLGSSLNGFKSFKNKIKVEVSKKGELELQSKRLEYEIEKLEKTMAEAINELQSLNKDVDLEKNQLLLESDSYPDGFVESMKEQLGEMITEGGTLFTSCFNVKGVSSDGADLTRYTNEYLDKYGLEKNLVATKLIENYAEGILDFKTLCDEIQMLEDHYYERYPESHGFFFLKNVSGNVS